MRILRIINSIKETEDDNLQMKLLTSLKTIPPSQISSEGDEIVTSNVVYETAHIIFSRGMGPGSASMMRFLTAVLRAVPRSVAGARAPAPASVARDLLRRSGCLHDMLDMFLDTMIMNNDGLNILCECLSESCKDCEDNQNYCSGLIPTCLQRCDLKNNRILKLLHSLMLNNTRNINLFVECNGIGTICTRDAIQDSSKIELLSIVVENSAAANLLQRNTDLLNFLITVGENSKLNHQGSWKMAEWASVILFHIASQIEGEKTTTHLVGADNSGRRSLNKMDIQSSSSDLSVSFLLKPNWKNIESENVFKNTKRGNKRRDYISEKSSNTIKTTSFNALRDVQISLHSSLDITTEKNFIPTFASTPKRLSKAVNERLVTLSEEVQEKNKVIKRKNYFQRERGNSCDSLINKKSSASARLFEIVNNSCVSIYNMMENVFVRNLPYMRSREEILNSNPTVLTPKSRLTHVTKRTQHTGARGNVRINSQGLQKRKFALNQKYRNAIIKKLKTGIHFYGCNFKKIAQAMWSQEKQMTAHVLYKIYRKFIAGKTNGKI